MRFINNIVSGLVDKRVDERINEIIKSDDFLVFRDISDKEAKKEITKFILQKKDEGVTQLTTFDFVLKLKIPAVQVERIIEKFEKEKRVEEINA